MFYNTTGQQDHLLIQDKQL